MDSAVMAKIVKNNVNDFENIKINELMIVAIKSYREGKEEMRKEILKDLGKLDQKFYKISN